MPSAFLPTRAVLSLRGPDAVSFLQGVVTQNVDGLADGEARFSALLTPQGKIIADFFLLRTADGFLIDVEAGAAEGLAKRLALYRLRAKVAIEPAPGLAVGALWGGVAAPEGVTAFQDPRLPALGLRVIGPAESVRGAAGAVAADYEALRTGLGVPAFGADFGAEQVFLLDVNYDALRAVDYRKGCFVGQEVTSRMKRKGEIRKRTLTLRFDGPAPPKGAAVSAGDLEIGEVLGSAGGAALALIRADRLAASGESVIAAGGAEVRVVVPDWLAAA